MWYDSIDATCECGASSLTRLEAATKFLILPRRLHRDRPLAVRALAVQPVERRLRRRHRAQPLDQACRMKRLRATVARHLGDLAVDAVRVAHGALARVLVGAFGARRLRRRERDAEDGLEVEADRSLRLPKVELRVERARRSGPMTRSAPRKASSGSEAGAATCSATESEQCCPSARRRLETSRVGCAGSSTQQLASRSSSSSHSGWWRASSAENCAIAAASE